MGLFDGFGFDPNDPRKAGLLAAAAAILQSRGNLSNAVGQGLMSGMAGYQTTRGLLDRRAEEEQQRKMRDIAIRQGERTLAGQEATDALGRQAFAEPTSTPPDPYEFDQMGPGTPQPQTVNTPGGGGMPAYIKGLMAIPGGPEKAIALQQAMAKDSPYGKIDPKDYTAESVAKFAASGGRDYTQLRPRSKMEVSAGAVYDPYAVTPGSTVTGPESEVIPDGNGGWKPNPAKVELKRAGAPSVSVTTGNHLAGELGKGTGEVLNNGRTAAVSAVDTITSGNQIRAALDSGSVMAGPGTSKVKVPLVQLSQALGLGGDGSPESLVRTRQVIIGMANQALNARGALKGQGQISDFEGKVLEKAKAGNIDDMTVPEIRALVDVNDRAARVTLKRHNTLVDTLAKNPAYKESVPFYRVDEPPAYSQQGGWSVTRVK